MKTEDFVILGAAAAMLYGIYRFVTGKPILPSFSSYANPTIRSAPLTADNSYGMADVTDVERPLFKAAGLGDYPTMEQQMAYYYKDGM